MQRLRSTRNGCRAGGGARRSDPGTGRRARTARPAAPGAARARGARGAAPRQRIPADDGARGADRGRGEDPGLLPARRAGGLRLSALGDLHAAEPPQAVRLGVSPFRQPGVGRPAQPRLLREGLGRRVPEGAARRRDGRRRQSMSGPAIETFPVGPLQCNCTVLADESTGEAVVIDPGDEPERILRVLTSMKWKPIALLHTHAHLDHITGSRVVKEATGAAIRLHDADRQLYEALPEQAAFFGFRAQTPLPLDAPLSDGETIRFGRFSLKALHTPGHTPGST